jgi:aminoglycoside phosphotransferase (APT) family kinase protein
MTRALHSNELPIDAELVRALVGRAMPDYADAPVRRLASSGSTNALFRLGEEFLVRLPRQPGGSATISKEATWLPVLGPRLPVSVPEVVAVFEPDRGYPERWSLVRWIDGEHPEVVDPETSVDPRREDLARDLAAVLEALQHAEVTATTPRVNEIGCTTFGMRVCGSPDDHGSGWASCRPAPVAAATSMR